MSIGSVGEFKVPQSATRSSRISRPRFGSIRDACRYSGLGRSSLYAEAAKHPGLFRKWNGGNGKTLVDLDKLDAILSALPPAEIKLPHLAKARRG